MYIKDDNLPSFEPKDFINIFNNRLPFLTYQILGYKIKYNLAYGNSLNGFYSENRNIIRKNADIFKDKKLSDIMHSAEYWKIIGEETEDYNMIIVNIPLNLKLNEKDEIIDRLVLENKKIKPTKSLAVVSVYPLINGNLKYADNQIFSKFYKALLNRN